MRDSSEVEDSFFLALCAPGRSEAKRSGGAKMGLTTGRMRKIIKSQRLGFTVFIEGDPLDPRRDQEERRRGQLTLRFLALLNFS
jgi:hypothetical protein